jgi:flagellar basal-body rod protein FlgB
MAGQSDAAIVQALRQQMTVAAARQMVAASNLANASTPGYRAREVDFSAALDRHVADGVQLVSTQPGHLTAPGAASPGGAASVIKTREAADADATARRDGNSVQLDRELLSMTRAAGDFAQAQTALAAKFKLLRYAINEGR